MKLLVLLTALSCLTAGTIADACSGPIKPEAILINGDAVSLHYVLSLGLGTTRKITDKAEYSIHARNFPKTGNIDVHLKAFLDGNGVLISHWQSDPPQGSRGVPTQMWRVRVGPGQEAFQCMNLGKMGTGFWYASLEN